MYYSIHYNNNFNENKLDVTICNVYKQLKIRHLQHNI